MGICQVPLLSEKVTHQIRGSTRRCRWTCTRVQPYTYMDTYMAGIYTYMAYTTVRTKILSWVYTRSTLTPPKTNPNPEKDPRDHMEMPVDMHEGMERRLGLTAQVSSLSNYPN